MLTQLMKEHPCYELMLNDGKSVRKVEANLTVASFSKKKKQAKSKKL